MQAEATPRLDAESLSRLDRLTRDLPWFAETCLRIRTKAGRVEPLVLNEAQLLLHEKLEAQRKRTGRVRAIVVKGRQQGCSTYVAARFFHRAIFTFGQRVAVMTHLDDSTAALFGMVHRYVDNLPDWLCPSTKQASAKALAFDELDSGYMVATAGSKAAGRGETIQLFHGSEVAQWPHAEDHMAGIGQAVPDAPGTEIILESTAKGLGNLFHRLAMRAIAGDGDFELVFIPWFLQTEYRRPVPPGWERTPREQELVDLHGLDDEQLAWRRAKIESDFTGDEVRFCEEYPSTVEEAFQAEARETLISARDVALARRHAFPDPPRGPLVLGVDPARFGDDRSAFAWRKGRSVVRVSSAKGWSTMQVVGRVVRAIREDKPVRVFVDVIGIGAGVVDRLHELGYADLVVGVNVAEVAQEVDRWHNRRSEVWGRLAEWLADRPCSIPDSDALAQDLLQCGYKYDSQGRKQLESKDEIRKREAMSPDLGDAVALTFAEFVANTVDLPASVYRADPAAYATPMADPVGGY